MEGSQQRAGIFTGHRKQKPTRSLRIEHNGLGFFRNSFFVTDQSFGEFAVGFESAGYKAGLNAFDRTFQQRQGRGPQPKTYAAAHRHFPRMADQAKTSDVSRGVDAELTAGYARRCRIE